jgi:hypothetical protein
VAKKSPDLLFPIAQTPHFHAVFNLLLHENSRKRYGIILFWDACA